MHLSAKVEIFEREQLYILFCTGVHAWGGSILGEEPVMPFPHQSHGIAVILHQGKLFLADLPVPVFAGCDDSFFAVLCRQCDDIDFSFLAGPWIASPPSSDFPDEEGQGRI